MSARDDYPYLLKVESLPLSELMRAEITTALNEIDRLRRWKAEAECVIEEWDQVWEEVGCPGSLGTRKAQGIYGLILTLKDHKSRLREELAKHGWGDFHYTPQGAAQDPAIVMLLEDTR